MTPRPALAALMAAISLSACSGSPAPVRAQVPPATRNFCPAGDSPVSEQALGFDFCVPAAWRFRERYQPTQTPAGVDATYDITDTSPGDSNGLFGYMIISADTRGPATSVAQWATANVDPSVRMTPLQWGNAMDAGREVGTSRYYALTPHHVVVMELRSGAGNLDLQSALEKRLSLWRFTY